MTTNALDFAKSYDRPCPYKGLDRAQKFSKWEDFYYMKDLEYAVGPYHYTTDPNRHWPLTACDQYVPFVGNPHLKHWGIDRSMVFMESDLKNQVRPASKVPSRKYHPNDKPLRLVKNMKKDKKNMAEGFNNDGPFHYARQSGPGRMRSPYADSPAVNCFGCPNCNLGLPCECDHCKYKRGLGMNNRSVCKNQIIPVQTRPLGKACNIPGVFINRFEDTCFDYQNPSTIQSNWYIGMDTRNDIKDNMAQFDLPKIAKTANLPKVKPCNSGGSKLGCKNYPWGSMKWKSF